MTIMVTKMDWRQIINLISFDGDEINIAANFEVADGYAPICEVEQKIYHSFHFEQTKKFHCQMFAHNEGKTYYFMRADRPIDVDLLKEAHEKFLDK